jgi:thiamine-monophosphate kinase
MQVINMDLKQVGEFGLIDLIKEDTIVDPGSVVVGIGDDAAVLLASPRQLQLVTTDMMVEDIHFSLKTTTPWQLGYKSLAVNISDIAAMGGVPRHAVISLAIPKQLSVDFIVNLYQGMKEICREYGVNIVGGDTVGSRSGLVINAAVLGEVEPSHLLKRSGAKTGDLVIVSGTLGNSGAGLELLSRGNWENFDFAWPLVTAHLTPRPQVKIGRMIALAGATSADDISDGLASEVNEIASASQVGMRIYADKIPLSPELKQAAAKLGMSAVDFALYGGEDYQLLFTMHPAQFSPALAAEAGVSLSVIGEVTPREGGAILVGAGGRASPLAARGYNHFR